MKTVAALIIVLNVFALLPSSVLSECSDILQDGIYNQTDFHIDAQNKQEAVLFIYDNEYENEQTRRGAALQAIWKSIPIRLTYNQENYNLFKRTHSQYYRNVITSRTRAYIHNRLASDSIIDAWSKCMDRENGGFYYKLEKRSNSLISVSPKYISPRNTLRIEGALLENLTVKLGEFPKEIVSGDNVAPVYLERTDPNLMSIFQLSGKDQNGAPYNITFDIPPKTPEIDNELIQLTKRFTFDSMTKNNVEKGPAHCRSKHNEYLQVSNVRVNTAKTNVSMDWNLTVSNIHGTCSGKSYRGPNEIKNGRASARFSLNGGTLTINATDVNVSMQSTGALEDYDTPNVVLRNHLKDLDGTNL